MSSFKSLKAISMIAECEQRPDHPTSSQKRRGVMDPRVMGMYAHNPVVKVALSINRRAFA